MAVDRVQPLKIEGPDSGGVETDMFPTSSNPNEDYLDCRGVTVQDATSDDETVKLDRSATGDMVFVDQNVPGGSKTLSQLASGSGMTPEDHRVLDQLAHNLDENYYEEYTYSGSLATNITVWETAAKLKKIRECQYTYSGSKVSQEVIIQYNTAGSEVERLTLAYAYSGTKVSSITSVRT